MAELFKFDCIQMSPETTNQECYMTCLHLVDYLYTITGG
jgi:hypothetical protein